MIIKADEFCFVGLQADLSTSIKNICLPSYEIICLTSTFIYLLHNNEHI